MGNEFKIEKNNIKLPQKCILCRKISSPQYKIHIRVTTKRKFLFFYIPIKYKKKYRAIHLLSVDTTYRLMGNGRLPSKYYGI
jgi:hypothetical protein